jgi:hypothetical protein
MKTHPFTGGRLRLRAYVRTIGNRPTLDEQVQLQQRRDRLRDQLDAFHHSADTFLDAPVEGSEEPAQIAETPAVVHNIPADDDDDWDVDPNGNPFRPVDSGAYPPAGDQPESMAVMLPSSLGTQWCQEEANKPIVDQEISLRKGQANDALHQIRIALAHKSFLFRTSIRNANSQQKKTRAWQSINSTESSVRHHAAVYSKARKALLSLAAPEAVMDRYKVLRQSDLGVSTAVIDIRKPSRSDATLAWFWNLDVQGDTQSHGWMAECVYIVLRHETMLTGSPSSI